MPVLARALLAQVIAGALVVGAMHALPLRSWQALVLDVGLVLALSAALRLPWWWWVVGAAFPLLVVGGMTLDWPWWVWALALLVSALVFGGGLTTRVPLYLSHRQVAEELAALLPQRAGARACDVGAGLGDPALALARLRPDARVTGIEASPLPWLIARWRTRTQQNVEIRFGDLFRHPLHDYDLVYAFLSPAPMPRLWDKACREMPPGSLLVSNTFAVPGVASERMIPLPGRADAKLFVYRIPLKSPHTSESA
ncbi:MAG: class I SAM-dependent methyltransferase [Planctomycetota bacterium]|nr:class I SAM-dependent methyltransferase [Planctomycetota bacterium]MCX8040013.1 class I SAM-dependent methyltransferase [Planctomycetota bacterium]MDW8372615.1 class I SAM-dependent methyltransferase [Planctomycetota bacterium]